MSHDLHWQQAYRLADSLPYLYSWPAKRRAIGELLKTLHQALVSGRRQ